MGNRFVCRKNLLCAVWKHYLSINLMSNELRQEIGGGTLAERERILGSSERIKGDAERDFGKTLEEDSASRVRACPSSCRVAPG